MKQQGWLEATQLQQSNHSPSNSRISSLLVSLEASINRGLRQVKQIYSGGNSATRTCSRKLLYGKYVNTTEYST
ncbi:hypothetical protein D5086_030471 [Populus alba]|uniref:Uncharacterized protein n=1 Tax=Populus alba TaxID=43335 RepID=A0ACC4ANM3_POPAL